ncbi:MAG TPA: hypothetical protein VJS44_04600 [Pyrinomonadaceae bacterium]|nr:hypothetical protein [Pyrinomonadaceae bacterium]
MRNRIPRSIFSIFAALILLAAIVAENALARTSSSLVVQIPFDFQVAGKTLSAGRYVVERSTLFSADGLSLRNTEKKQSAFVLTSTVQSNLRQSESRLVFTRYKDQYFLSQFWTSGEASGRELIKSDRELSVERELAKAGVSPERVSVAAVQKK